MSKLAKAKFILCSLCGQFGQQLKKRIIEADKFDYICGDKWKCALRQDHRKLMTQGLCSFWKCLKRAEYQCSCRATLCKEHLKDPVHKGHLIMSLNKKAQ